PPARHSRRRPHRCQITGRVERCASLLTAPRSRQHGGGNQPDPRPCPRATVDTPSRTPPPRHQPPDHCRAEPTTPPATAAHATPRTRPHSHPHLTDAQRQPKVPSPHKIARNAAESEPTTR